MLNERRVFLSFVPKSNKTILSRLNSNNSLLIIYSSSKHYKIDNEIPFQREAANRATGTDTDAFAYSKGAVPSVLLSLPLRYMHTTVEMAHIDDIEHTIKWIYEVLKVVKKGQSFKFI